MAVGKGTDWVQAPTLAQPEGSGALRKILVDDEGVIASVRHERWQLSQIRRQALEDEDKDAKKCEDARDKVLEWCENHDPRSGTHGCQNMTLFWKSWLPEHDLVLGSMAART